MIIESEVELIVDSSKVNLKGRKYEVTYIVIDFR